MKRTIAIALFALATWTANTSASAQEIAVRATIPFGFALGGEMLPAGDYTFTSPLAHTLRIKHGTRWTTAVFNESSALDASAGGGRLLFTRRGDQYSLTGVESSSASIHARLPQFHQPHATRAEHIAQAKGAKDNGTTVLVALR